MLRSEITKVQPENHPFPLIDCTVGVASPVQARQDQISRFLLVLGTEDVLALSKDTIGTAWASRVFFLTIF